MSAEKRQAILEGMLEAVGAEGYDATSVRTVLDRTGLYRQAFYDNFADKQECYLAAFDMEVVRVEGLMAAAAAGEETWLGRLCAGLIALLDFLDAEPDVGRALVVEVHALGEPGLERRTEAMQRAVEFIDRARGGVLPLPASRLHVLRGDAVLRRRGRQNGDAGGEAAAGVGRG